MTIGSRSSEKANPPPAGRWLIPSIGDLIFVALLGLLGFTNLSGRLLGDAGIGWHIRTGQLILATHSIPRVDPFSSTMVGHPWCAWAERRRLSHRPYQRPEILEVLSNASPAWYKLSRGSWLGAPGRIGSHD